MLLSRSSVNITPKAPYFPSYMSGHAMRTELAVGILDDIFVRVLNVAINKERLLLIAVELIGLSKEFSEEVINYVADKYNVNKENVIVSFTHTHSGPEINHKHFNTKHDNSVADKYMVWVLDKIKEAVDLSFTNKEVLVKAYMKKTIINGLYGSRNDLEYVGDKDFIVLKFVDEDSNTVANIINFACHPTVLGPQNLEISSDVSGYISKHYESLSDNTTIVILGAAGDMSNRLYRKGYDKNELERVANGIIAQNDKNDKFKEIDVSSLNVSRINIKKSFDIDYDDLEARYVNIKNIIETTDSFDIKKVYTSALSFLDRTLNNRVATHDLDLEFRVINIGELKILTFPGELFSIFGLELKTKYDFDLIFGYTFYNGGYYWDEASYGTSFESAVSTLPKDITKQIFSELFENM